jgi:hypothetical protein
MKEKAENMKFENTSGSLHISDGNTFRFTQPLKLNFNPKEDITAYELAVIIPAILSGRSFYQTEYDALPVGVKRHLETIS